MLHLAQRYTGRQAEIRSVCEIVASQFFGDEGRWLYAAFDAINLDYFGGRLPVPLITIEITPHGKCLGSTQSGTPSPIVRIHPTLFGRREKENPWGVPDSWLGQSYAFDVLLHELVHVNVAYLLGGVNGPTSHNNPRWVAEVNRLCPLIGLDGVRAGTSKPRRVDGRVQRVNDGNVPFAAVAKFPHSIRCHVGTAADWYQGNHLPIQV